MEKFGFIVENVVAKAEALWQGGGPLLYDAALTGRHNV